MQRIFIAVFTLATVVGCKSASDQLCEKNYECLDEEDPAAKCAEDNEECAEDEDCQAGRDACRAQNEALSSCILGAEAKSECQGIGDIQLYLPTEDDVCGDELDAFLNCQEDN